MVGLSLKEIRLRFFDLFFKRIFFLVVIVFVVFYITVDRHLLKVKTLNFLMPDAQNMKELNEHPEEMERQKLTSLLIYYKKVCEFEANDPEQPAPCSFAAYAYYYLGKTKKAVQYYEKAAKSNPYFFWFRYNLGAIYFNEARYDKAAEQFQQALTIPPPNSMYFLTLTKTYKDLASLLKLNTDMFIDNLYDGYAQAKKLFVISTLLKNDPGMKTQLDVQKIKLRLY